MIVEILLFVITILGFFGFMFGAKIFIADNDMYERNKQRSVSVINTIKGETPVVFDHGRDDQVAAGIVYDIGKKEYKPQGRLSDEALDDIHP